MQREVRAQRQLAAGRILTAVISAVPGGVIERAASVGKTGEGCPVDPSDGVKVNQVVVSGGVVKPTDGAGKTTLIPMHTLLKDRSMTRRQAR